jgi:hypothetical protein
LLSCLDLKKRFLILFLSWSCILKATISAGGGDVMDKNDQVRIHMEAEQGDEERILSKAALTSFGIAVAILVAGFLWLGRDGMLNPHSPDFFPLPHFCAFVGVLLSVFFLVRALIHGRRYRLFGTSEIEGNQPVLGERFAGMLRVAKPQSLSAPITLWLCCNWRHYGEGTSSVVRGSETTDTLWETSLALSPDGAADGIPFEFDIPEDGLPSGRRPKPKAGVHPEPAGQIIWVLRALSPRWGTDYYEEFEIVVKPGRIPAELGKQIRPALSKRDKAAGRTSFATRGASLLGNILSLIIGGRVPDAAEISAEAEAETRPEPATPFASKPWEDQSGPRKIGRIALVVGIFLGVIALYTLSRQAVFGWHGWDMTAKITKVERNLVTLDLGAKDPVHPIYVSAFHHWNVGQLVTVLCETADDGGRRCRMVSGYDRWLEGMVALFVALTALSIWRHMSGGGTPRAM